MGDGKGGEEVVPRSSTCTASHRQGGDCVV